MKKWQDIKVLVIIIMFYLVLELVFGITCPIRFLTGISCAGCGMSRAWFSVLRSDFASAFQYHPLFWMLPLGIVCFFYWEKIPKKIRNLLLMISCAMFVGVYIWRMLDPTDSIVVFQPEEGAIISLISTLCNDR